MKAAAQVASFTQRQWYSRPDDQKYADIEQVVNFTAERKAKTRQLDTQMSKVAFTPDPEDDRGLRLSTEDGQLYTPTHWSFSQVCALVGAHASYLRDLPANLTADCLNYGLKKRVAEKNKGVGLMVVDPRQVADYCELHAVTSQSYGRIWDAEIARAAAEIVGESNGRFYSPLDWSKEKRALFASDRDIHLLFIDGGSIVDGGGERDQLNRGWIIGNSEVGASAYYMATFLFRWICGNFAIHGLEDVIFTRIRHTAGAPMKFVKEAIPALQAYVNASPKPLEDVIKRAKDYRLPKDITEHTNFFRNRGFTAAETQIARLLATREEGGFELLWQMVNGFTRSAQRIRHADARTNLERRAGSLLKLVA